MPSIGVLLAAAGGAATLVVAAALFVRPSEAPARAGAGFHLSASAGGLAVLDGDTLRVGDQVVRLAGIAAPARGSVCHGPGAAALDCGAEAANALAARVRDSGVDCTIQGHDEQGRPVGLCLAAGRGLSDAQVRDGWARATSVDLRQTEVTARSAGRGIWHAGS